MKVPGHIVELIGSVAKIVIRIVLKLEIGPLHRAIGIGRRRRVVLLVRSIRAQ